jgi:hypothetical protein
MKQAASGLTILFSIWLMGSALVGQQPRQPKMPPIAELGPATLTVNGISGSTATLTAADLYGLPQQTVKTTDHGTAVIFQGVLLTDVLAKVKTPTGEAFNKTVASYYLVVEAADGYKAIFSWPEVDPSFTDRKMYIVTRRDGMPLSHKDGPFELIVPGEKRYSRWVRQLKTLRVEPLPTASAYDSEQARWIAASLTDMQSIKPGMTRGELLKVFMGEGGISSRTWRRYVYRRCGFIKVDVEFAPAGDPKSTAESPDDPDHENLEAVSGVDDCGLGDSGQAAPVAFQNPIS